MSVTREQWASAFLQGIRAPVTQRNLVTMVVWIGSEGGEARWNPLNTTKRMPGSTDYNSIGVQEYTSYGQGLEAALDTVRESGHKYEPILFRLRKNRHSWWTLKALYASDWGTGKIPFMLRSVKHNFTAYASQLVAD